MFGRRKPERTNHTPQETPLNDLDLDFLEDLPDISAFAAPDAPLPEPEQNTSEEASLHTETITSPADEPKQVESDPAWHASAPLLQAKPPIEAPRTVPLPPKPAIAQITTPVAPEPEPAPPLAAHAGFPPPAVERRPEASIIPAATAKPPIESVIGIDDFFDGNYRSERGVRIQGTARGAIESRQYIFVEEGAQVEANLSAEEIRIAGSCSGQIRCQQRLEVTSTGRIKGLVQTAILIVHEGGVIDGELHMGNGS